jgi:Tfp pilus assembly protein PilF
VPEPTPFFANLQRGSLLLDQNRPKDALPFFQAAIAANPDHPEGYAGLARCYNQIPALRSKSIGAINRAIALVPANSRYFGLKGWFLVCLASYRQAYNAAQQGLAINPTCYQSLNSLANAHTKLGQWKKAEAACLRVLALNPSDGPGLNLLAQALRHQGRWKEAREVVARILAQMPNNAFGHANAGFAALAAGDHLRANEHFLESLRLNPHFDLARRGLLSSLRARNWIIRFNMRYLSWVRRPLTPGYAAAVVGTIFVFVTLVCLFAALSDTFVGKIGGYALAYLFAGCLCYLYLSALIGLLSNFLLLFDPVGRHALTLKEKTRALGTGLIFFFAIVVLIANQVWFAVAGLILTFFLIALSIQFPLLKDRWLRRREQASDD